MLARPVPAIDLLHVLLLPYILLSLGCLYLVLLAGADIYKSVLRDDDESTTPCLLLALLSGWQAEPNLFIYGHIDVADGRLNGSEERGDAST